jgi:hypothetical protein
LKKNKTKATSSHISQLNDIDHMWNVALDNYEDEGNDGQESLVGDESDHGKPTNIHKWWPIPYTLKKLGVSKPNIAPTFFLGTTIMSQGATCDLGVMFEFVTSVGIHG